MKIYQGFFFICCAFAIWIGIAAAMDYFYPKEQGYYMSFQQTKVCQTKNYQANA